MLKVFQMFKEKENRNKIIFVRLKESEYKVISESARESGLNNSVYIRKILLGYKVRKRKNVNSEKAIYELSKIGNNLNQIAKRANIGNYDEAYIKKTLDNFNNILSELLSDN